MTGVAGFLDLVNILVELIPVLGAVIGFIIDIVIAAGFYVWMAHYEVKLYSAKNAPGSMVAFVMNALPITDLTFPWTIRIGSLAFTEEKEIPTNAQTRATARQFRL